MRIRRSPWLICVALLSLLVMSAFPQTQEQEDGPLDSSLPEGVTVRDIISRFAAQELTFKQAREHYTYRQVVKMQTISDSGFPDGEYDDTFDVTFNDQGERAVKEVSHPRDTLKRIKVTPEDIDDIRNRLPFVLTTDEIPDYNIKYRGQQDTRGTHTYVFDISPKAMEQDRRYFEGRIWVDANQYQIVKSSGKAVPDIYNETSENLFPSFTTYRELVDGKYWFPSYTKSDDYLHFSTESVHVLETVDYINYKRFGAESRIIFNGQEVGNGNSQKPPTQTSGGQRSPANEQQYPTGTQGNAPQSRAPQDAAAPTAAPQQSRPPARLPQQQPANPPPQPAQYVQQTLMTLEREISDAINKRDVSLLERILTDDYRLVSANGDAEDKFGLLDDIHQNRAGTFGQPENMQVQINGDRAIVVGERDESVPVARNKVQTARVRFTDTFVRRAGEWALVQTKEGPAR
ncbi:MAG: nuclear transport factor 2 family protein [Terriglobales bacterium]